MATESQRLDLLQNIFSWRPAERFPIKFHKIFQQINQSLHTYTSKYSPCDVVPNLSQ